MSNLNFDIYRVDLYTVLTEITPLKLQLTFLKTSINANKYQYCNNLQAQCSPKVHLRFQIKMLFIRKSMPQQEFNFLPVYVSMQSKEFRIIWGS